MRRVFTFGCSYTAYSWVSYVNFLELEYGKDNVENWGLSGLGNRAIAERISECHVKNKFTKDDLIIVQWSTHLRNDWFHQEPILGRRGSWKTFGSIFNYHNVKLYDRRWLDTFFYEPAFFMHTLNNIILVQGLLESIGCEWYMTSIGDIRSLGNDMRDNSHYGEKTTIEQYAKGTGKKLAWDIIPDLEIYNKPIWENHKDHWLMPMELFCQTCPELTYEFFDQDGVPFTDLHPSPMQHLLWIKQELKDKLNLSDTVFANGEEIINHFAFLHTKFKYDKRSFEVNSSIINKFPEHLQDKINWPGCPKGF